MNGYQEIQDMLMLLEEQVESVRGKETPFRVEFRYRGGTKHWRYFASLEDARKAEDCRCYYSPAGKGIIEKPLSRQIQKRGPRDGWKAYRRDEVTR